MQLEKMETTGLNKFSKDRRADNLTSAPDGQRSCYAAVPRVPPLSGIRLSIDCTVSTVIIGIVYEIDVVLARTRRSWFLPATST